MKGEMTLKRVNPLKYTFTKFCPKAMYSLSRMDKKTKKWLSVRKKIRKINICLLESVKFNI